MSLREILRRNRMRWDGQSIGRFGTERVCVHLGQSRGKQ